MTLLPLTVYQSSGQPLAFNFFNPAIDLQRVESPVPHSTNIGVRTEQGSANLGQVTQPIRRSDSLARRTSFLSLPRSSPLPLSSRFPTHSDSATVRERLPLARTTGEHGRPAGMSANVG